MKYTKLIVLTVLKKYIGLTSRNLKDRLTSHRSAIRRWEKNACVLSEHASVTCHHPNFADLSVLEIGRNNFKSSLLEMAHIP